MFHCIYYYNQSVDWFNNDLRYHVMYIYIYILVYYSYTILMIYFTIVFGDTPSGVYGIYVVLHVTYGRTYVKATQDDGFFG